jgi:hypothetical protein
MFRISQEELADRPGSERLRRRLLWSVLGYYQELLEQRHEGLEAQADLREAKQRVEQVLADLVVLHAASQLYLLRQPAVIDDLRMDDQQRRKVKAFCDRVGKGWRESFEDVGRLSFAERGRRAVERARAYEAEVGVLLTPVQQARLRQIGLQAEGPGAFGEPEVVAELNLTPEQREQVRRIEEGAILGWMRGTRPGPEKSVNDRIVAVLTEDQARRWGAMTGERLKAPIAPFAPPPTVFGPPGGKAPSR